MENVMVMKTSFFLINRYIYNFFYWVLFVMAMFSKNIKISSKYQNILILDYEQSLVFLKVRRERSEKKSRVRFLKHHTFVYRKYGRSTLRSKVSGEKQNSSRKTRLFRNKTNLAGREMQLSSIQQA